MKPYYADDAVTVLHADCLDALAEMAEASVDAVVTDPPYGLEFMGKDWDGADGFRRSLNPADTGRDNAFGRTSRTSPEYRTDSKAAAAMMPTGYTDGATRLARPSHLGSLNPKCRTCAKWQRGGNPCSCTTPDFPDERLPRLHDFQVWCEAWAAECLRVLKPGGHLLAFGGSRTWHRLASAIEDSGFELRDSIAWLYGSGFPKSLNLLDDAGERTGWGTALKPAFEPIVVARKPMRGTVAANVAQHGTGALNIDAARTSGAERPVMVRTATTVAARSMSGESTGATSSGELTTLGRWPTNVALDVTQADELDAQTGVSASRIGKPRGAASGDGWGMTATGTEYDDLGGASRFYPTFRYEAKAPTSERPRDGITAHPTVKPLDLMRWLVRLVTPRGGHVLDPFAGSGTTAEACILEGFTCTAIEREATYLPLIKARLSKPLQPGLDFGDAS